LSSRLDLSRVASRRGVLSRVGGLISTQSRHPSVVRSGTRGPGPYRSPSSSSTGCPRCVGTHHRSVPGSSARTPHRSRPLPHFTPGDDEDVGCEEKQPPFPPDRTAGRHRHHRPGHLAMTHAAVSRGSCAVGTGPRPSINPPRSEPAPQAVGAVGQRSTTERLISKLGRAGLVKGFTWPISLPHSNNPQMTPRLDRRRARHLRFQEDQSASWADPFPGSRRGTPDDPIPLTPPRDSSHPGLIGEARRFARGPRPSLATPEANRASGSRPIPRWIVISPVPGSTGDD
jgi:hypothetical protein